MCIVPYYEETRPWAASNSIGSWSGVNVVHGGYLTTNVTTNRGGENPFLVTKAWLNGSEGTNVGANRIFTLPGPSNILLLSPEWASTPPVNEANIWARTNPSRPAVLLPVALFELHEIPDMIRQAGRFLLHARRWRDFIRPSSFNRDVATANLAFQFGWAPLVGDLLKIARFQESVDRRRREIDKLYSGRGLRRRISLDSGGGRAATRTQFASFGSFTNVSVSLEGTTHFERWAVVKWKPTRPSVLPPSDGELRAHLLGLHPSHILENVWEALPWTWLIDYFTNIGDVIQAGNHYVATPAGGTVMTRSTTMYTHREYTFSAGRCRLTPASLRYEQKRREVIGSPVLSAQLPNLTTGQLSILGSLAILRAR